MSRTNNDPSVIFQLFATHCMDLEPAIHISKQQAAIVASIIDDISKGRVVSAFKAGARFSIMPIDPKSVPGAARCSTYLGYFLEFLCEQMLEQKAQAVSPLRATELLYNYDGRGAFPDQPFMRLEGPMMTRFAIASTKNFEKRAGCKMRMYLPLHDSDDWTINPVE